MPPRRQAASIPRKVPITNERMKPQPTRKIEYGRVLRMISVTGTCCAVDMPRLPVRMLCRYVGYARQIGSSAEPSDAFSCLMRSGLFWIAVP